MSQEEVWTIKRLLEWTTDYLKKNGADSARLDAEILLADALGWKRIDLYTQFNHIPGDSQKSTFRDFVKRRAKGEPVAYLVGHKEFYSLSFCVTPDVLIPRPETEHLVVESLDTMERWETTESFHLCDVGTGSGAVAVSIAKHAPKCRVTAIDICPKTLEVAIRNAKKHSVDDRIRFHQGDLLENFSPDPQFHVIASNPPYVSEEEYATLAPEIKNFEPRTALVAENKGKAVILRLIDQAALRLYSGGAILIELSPMIAYEIENVFKNQPHVWSEVRVIRDLAGRERIVTAKKP